MVTKYPINTHTTSPTIQRTYYRLYGKMRNSFNLYAQIKPRCCIWSRFDVTDLLMNMQIHKYQHIIRPQSTRKPPVNWQLILLISGVNMDNRVVHIVSKSKHFRITSPLNNKLVKFHQLITRTKRCSYSFLWAVPYLLSLHYWGFGPTVNYYVSLISFLLQKLHYTQTLLSTK